MKRRAFTLVELVVVVMIIGILVAIAAPKMINIVGDATDNSARQSLTVLRDAIETYAAQNGGSYPSGTDAQIKTALRQYLRGPFPKCPVGGGTADALAVSTDNPVVSDNAGGWMYNATTGEVIINSTATSKDGSTAYNAF